MEPEEHRRLLAPMGIATTISADDPELLETACAACPSCPEELRDGSRRIHVRLTTEIASPTGLSCEIGVEGSRLRLTGSDFRGWADAEAATAECSVPRRLFGDNAGFAAEIFDTLLLFLLARSGRTPVHAAGLLAGETALILAGPSGSGKSSLAFAWHRRGFPLLSDDAVFVQTEPALRIWGLPRPIHLFPADARGLGGAIRLRNGKSKQVVALSTNAGACVTERAVVVLLERGERISIAQVEPAEAFAALMKLEPGFDLLRTESREAVAAIAKAGAWRLTLGNDPDDAIECLLRQLPLG